VTRGYLRVVAASAVAGLLLGPVIGLQGASAAQFPVSAAPIQTWKITHGLPDLPAEPSADLADPTPETSAAPDVHGGDQDPAAPAAGDPRPADDQGQGGKSGQTSSQDEGSSDPASGSEQPPGGAGSDPADDGAAGVSEVTQDITGP
jgi:hypothetical protein